MLGRMDHLWLRVAGIAVTAILAALLLAVAPPPVVLAVFVAATIGGFAVARRARQSLRAARAEIPRLRSDHADPFRLLALPLALFSRAGDPAIVEATSAPWRGLELRAVSLSMQPPAVLDVVPERVTFSVAIAELDRTGPALVVEPQVFRTSMPSPPPEPAVATGDAAFDASTGAWSGDEEFARAFLDPAARAWLRSLEHGWGLEVRGGLAAVYGPRTDRIDSVSAPEVLRELLDRLKHDVGSAPA
jgi:hypothetical protein